LTLKSVPTQKLGYDNKFLTSRGVGEYLARQTTKKHAKKKVRGACPDKVSLADSPVSSPAIAPRALENLLSRVYIYERVMTN
jgi:hypothetical protein